MIFHGGFLAADLHADELKHHHKSHKTDRSHESEALINRTGRQMKREDVAEVPLEHLIVLGGARDPGAYRRNTGAAMIHARVKGRNQRGSRHTWRPRQTWRSRHAWLPSAALVILEILLFQHLGKRC